MDMGRKKVIAFLLSICMVMGNASTLMADQTTAVSGAEWRDRAGGRTDPCQHGKSFNPY